MIYQIAEFVAYFNDNVIRYITMLMI